MSLSGQSSHISMEAMTAFLSMSRSRHDNMRASISSPFSRLKSRGMFTIYAPKEVRAIHSRVLPIKSRQAFTEAIIAQAALRATYRVRLSLSTKRRHLTDDAAHMRELSGAITVTFLTLCRRILGMFASTPRHCASFAAPFWILRVNYNLKQCVFE